MALNRSIRYPGRFDSPTTERPQGAFKNRTAPGAKDGSYLEKDWANDWDGFFGSLMRSAGLTANGTPDNALESQYFNSLKLLLAKKISGDNCTDAGLTAGGTLPYMKKADGSIFYLASRVDTVLVGNTDVPTAPLGSSDERIASTEFVSLAIGQIPKNTASMGVDGWWKCGDTGLIRQRRRVFVGDLAGNTTKILVTWPVQFPNQCSSIVVTFESLAAATSNPRASAQYVVANRGVASGLIAFHEWTSEVQSEDLYIYVESEGY